MLRVSWGGGVVAADGAEVTRREWKRYQVALLTEQGVTRLVNPFAVGDLNDGDNNHELCLEEAGVPLGVKLPAGLLIDPNGDLNEVSIVRVDHVDE